MAGNRRKRTKKQTQTGSKVKALENRLNNLTVNSKKTRNRKKTPFGDTGHILGNTIGGMFGNAGIGAGIGRWLGTGIGSIFGSGDYHMVGASPQYNVIANGSQIPKFSTGRQTNVVCHREYLGDYIGTAGFSNNVFALNPGLSSTFPWLSSVAGNYQEYRWHGLVFEFRSLITDFVTSGAPGVVIMSTSYNADAPVYTTKQQMENAEYAVSTKPTTNLLHGVECDASQTPDLIKYVRTGAVATGQDLRLYDAGNFQFATQSNPLQNLGELWVSYCVEFFKPILPETLGSGTSSYHYGRTNALPASPFGLIGTSFQGGSLTSSITPTVISWLAQPGQAYLVNLYWSWGGPSAWTQPTITISSPNTYKFLWNQDTLSQVGAPTPAASTSNTACLMYVINCGLTAPGNITLTAGLAGVFPVANFDVHITDYDPSIVSGVN
jgi:hypothetical protein